MAWDALKKLHTALLDTQSGYQEAASDTEDAKLQTLFEGMITLRQRDHAALHEALTKLGERPDDSGSFMAAIHRTVIGVRSAVTGIDASSMSQFVSGEERILGEYDAALAEAHQRPELRELLHQQKAGVEAQVGKMRHSAA